MKTTDKIKLMIQLEKGIKKLDAAEINMLVGIIQDRRDVLSMEAHATFHVGDLISFSHTKKGWMDAQIIKINRKTAIVEILGHREKWKVPLSRLDFCPANARV
jgi:hypothetical protein